MIVIIQALLLFVILIVICVLAIVILGAVVAAILGPILLMYDLFVQNSYITRTINQWVQENTLVEVPLETLPTIVLQAQVSEGEIISLWFSQSSHKLFSAFKNLFKGIKVELCLTLPDASTAHKVFIWNYDTEDTFYEELSSTGMSSLETNDFNMLGFFSTNHRWLAICSPSDGLLQVEVTIHAADSSTSESLAQLIGSEFALRVGQPENSPPQTFSFFAKLRDRLVKREFF